MSHEQVKCQKSIDWFEQGKRVKAQREAKERELQDLETRFNKEQKRINEKIVKLKQTEAVYAKKDVINLHQKNISDYEKYCSTEIYMVTKMDYTIKCLEKLKSILILQANFLEDLETNATNANESDLLEDRIQPGLSCCDKGDDLSQSINQLLTYLESFVDTLKDNSKTLVKIFPSVLDLIRENYTLDSIIGLAHMLFIDDIRNNPITFQCDYTFNEYDKTVSRDNIRITEVPRYYQNNKYDSDPEWIHSISEENPAYMYIGEYQQYEMITCMADIINQGRYYNNRFGIRYGSSPNTIYWHFN